MRMIPLTLLVSFVVLGSSQRERKCTKHCSNLHNGTLNYMTDIGSREAVSMI